MDSTVLLDEPKSDSSWGYLARFTLAQADGANTVMMGDSTFLTTNPVSRLGDINGDGREDFAIGKPRYPYGGNTDSGVVFVVYGQDFASGASHVLDTEIGTTVQGVAIGGVAAQDHLGVAASGDINYDGAPDLMISAMQYAASLYSPHGIVYYLLSNSGVPPVLTSGVITNIASTTTTNSTSGYFGASIATGNIAWTHADDILIGAPLYLDRSNGDVTGAVFLCKGYKVDTANSLASTPSGCVKFIPDDLEGRSGYLGERVSIGDFDGDGCKDLLMGDRGANDYGSAYLIYRPNAGTEGSCNGFEESYGTTIDLTGLGVASGVGHIEGIKYVGETVNDIGASERAGAYLTFVGDADGDGSDDFVVTAYDYTRNTTTHNNEGAVHLIYGGHRFSSSNMPLGSKSGMYTYRGGSPSKKLGKTPAAAGDVNADGYADYIVTDFTRRAYLILGGPQEHFDKDIDTGDNVVQIYHSGYASGNYNATATGIGDINQDGYDDLLVGINRTTTEMEYYIVPGGCRNSLIDH